MQADPEVQKGKSLLSLRRNCIVFPWFPHPVSPAIPAPGDSPCGWSYRGSE